MAVNRKRAQRRADPNGVSLVSAGAPSHHGKVLDGKVLDGKVPDGRAGSRADDLDAEAAYYRYRAVQEEQALGPGYYVDLLQGMATDRAMMAQRLRTGAPLTLSRSVPSVDSGHRDRAAVMQGHHRTPDDAA